MFLASFFTQFSEMYLRYMTTRWRQCQIYSGGIDSKLPLGGAVRLEVNVEEKKKVE